MSCRLLAIVALSLVFHLAAHSQQSQKAPVVVELFTSEGCSDCPPADDLLSQLAKQPFAANIEVIPLAFHVTYWDQYGWHDRFSEDRFTQRQQDYQTRFHLSSVYTPQSVIDGEYETVGNDRPKVIALIQRAANSDKKPITIELTPNNESVQIRVHGAGNEGEKVLLAMTEDGLLTEVKAGENRSKTLHHNAVVRSLEEIGKVKDGEFSKTVPLKLKSGWSRENLHTVVLVQDGRGHIVGAATMKLPAVSTAAVRR